MQNSRTNTENVDRFFKVLFLGCLPVPIAALLMLLISSMVEAEIPSFDGYYTLVFWGYVVGIVPSLFFSALMEYVVVPKSPKNSTIHVVAIFFGLASGLIIGTLASGMSDGSSTSILIEIVLIGGTVGYIMGRFFWYSSPDHGIYDADDFVESRKEAKQHKIGSKHPKTLIQASANQAKSDKQPATFWWSIFGLSALQFCSMLVLGFSKEPTTILSLIPVLASISFAHLCLLIFLLFMKRYKQAGAAAAFFITFGLVFSSVFIMAASNT